MKAPDVNDCGGARFDDSEPIGTGEEKPKAFPVKNYSGIPAPIDWLMPGFIESGTCSILASEPKAGKTWLTFDLAIALATGQRFLEWQSGDRGKTLFYSPEGGDRSRHARVLGLCWGRAVNPNDAMKSLFFLDARLDLTAEGHAERLAATIDSTGARLVVVDPMISAAIGIDENDSGDIMRILNPLRDMIAARPKVALIVAHHHNKHGGKQSNALGVRGSSAIGGWWDTLITIRKADDDPRGPRRVDVAHRDAEDPNPLGFQLCYANAGPMGHPDLTWFRLDRCDPPETNACRGSPGRKRNPDLREKILELVKNRSGQLTRTAGAGVLRMTPHTFLSYFNELVVSGLVVVGENGKMEVVQECKN